MELPFDRIYVYYADEKKSNKITVIRVWKKRANEWVDRIVHK